RRPPAVDSLTAVRGVAAVWVVLYHFSPDLYVLLPASRALAPLIDRGHLAVPLFFTLSGYVLAMNYAPAFGGGLSAAGTKTFLLRRLIRIYPLHLATLLGTAAMVAVGARFGATVDPEGYGAVDFLLNLALLHAWVPDFRLNWNLPSWSISAEWFAYLLFPLLAAGLWRASAGRRGRAAVGAVAGLALIETVVFYLYWRARGLPFFELLSVVGPFTAGAAAWVWRERAAAPAGPWEPPGWAPWAATAVLVGGAFLPNVAAGKAVVLVGCVAVVVLLGAAGNRCPRAFRWRPLVALGEASYALYLTHVMAQKVLYTLLPSGQFADADGPVRAGAVAAYVAAIAAAAWLAQATIERRLVPWLRRRATVRRPG
ncbi:acyltransferase family protein, partial [Alienimonas sp. DA493]|uniref:acyltransferase family protein n=1 Tax=Alienimonas sp. DA493 TaxID=3373605 RepID=UPI0037545858